MSRCRAGRLARLEQRLGLGQRITLMVLLEEDGDLERQLAEARARYGQDAEFRLMVMDLRPHANEVVS